MLVVHNCITLKHALRAEKLGLDCISTDGIERVGHGGEYDTTLLMLLSLCAEQLNIPYLAIGAFKNGRQTGAILALEAVGVNMGTLWGNCGGTNPSKCQGGHCKSKRERHCLSIEKIYEYDEAAQEQDIVGGI